MRPLATFAFALLLCAATGSSAQERRPESVPVGIRGNWLVEANLSEHTLGCFDPPDAEALVGMHVAIGAHDLHWRRSVDRDLDPRATTLSTYAFLYRYGKMPQELGLSPAAVRIIDVHPAQGIPVNALVQIDRSTILIDACNIWLRATRSEEAAPAPAAK